MLDLKYKPVSACSAPPRALREIVRDKSPARLTAAVVGGVCAAWLLAGFVNRLLFGIGPHDPAAFAGALALLSAAAIGASWFPPRDARRSDDRLESGVKV